MDDEWKGIEDSPIGDVITHIKNVVLEVFVDIPVKMNFLGLERTDVVSPAIYIDCVDFNPHDDDDDDDNLIINTIWQIRLVLSKDQKMFPYYVGSRNAILMLIKEVKRISTKWVREIEYIGTEDEGFDSKSDIEILASDFEISLNIMFERWTGTYERYFENRDIDSDTELVRDKKEDHEGEVNTDDI